MNGIASVVTSKTALHSWWSPCLLSSALHAVISTTAVGNASNQQVAKGAGTSVAGRRLWVSVSRPVISPYSALEVCAVQSCKVLLHPPVLNLAPSFFNVQLVTSSLIAGKISILNVKNQLSN